LDRLIPIIAAKLILLFVTLSADSSRQDKSIKVYEQTKKPARRIVAETLVQAPVEEVRFLLLL
jgi:hypothetical protein